MATDLHAAIFGPQNQPGINPELEKLLMALQAHSGGGVPGAPTMNPAQPPAAPPVDPAAQYQPQIDQQTQVLEQPEPVYEAPVGEQSSLLQRLGLGIADAGSVYAAGLNPAVRPMNTLGQVLGLDQMNKATDAENVYRKQKATHDATQRGAEAKLRDVIYQRNTATDAANREADRKQRATERAEDREDRQTEATTSFERSAALSRELETMRGENAVREQRIRNSAKSDIDEVERRQLAREEREAVSTVKQAIIGTKSQVPELLKTQTPEQIRESFLEMMDVKNLKGDARVEALEYFLNKIEPMLAAEEERRNVKAEPSKPDATDYIGGKAVEGAVGTLKRGAGWLSKYIGPNEKKK